MTWGSVAWGGVGGSSIDILPPVIDNFVPDENVAIARTDPVQFDVTDNSGVFSAIIVHVRFLEDGLCECAYNGLNFEARYAAGSSRVREAPWPSAVRAPGCARTASPTGRSGCRSAFAPERSPSGSAT